MAKILISAYACEPNKGSEPEVGWQWATYIAKQHEVWVLTKDNNRENIEKYISAHPEYSMPNLHFVYVGFSKKLTFWKKGNRGMRPYYYMWQKKALRISKELHLKIGFDLVHSVTFVSLTQPCFLYKLGIPFVWTVAGGENIPSIINYPFLPKEKIYEVVRGIGQWKTKHSFRVRRAVEKASLILAATDETKKLINKKYYNKVVVTSAIGICEKQILKSYEPKENVTGLVSGKFIYLKGVDIGIKAALKVLDECPNVTFNILGNGPHEEEYKILCKDYIGTRIRFIDKIPHDDMYEFYKKHDFLVNTALRDSGCLVAMEAMSVGVPVVSIDTGGVMAMTEIGFSIKVQPCEYGKLIEQLAQGIKEYVENPNKCKEYGMKAYEHINNKYLYESKADWLIKQYSKIIKGEGC